MKSIITSLAIVASSIILVVFFIGFDFADYDNSDPAIGETVVFNEPMVYLRNLNKQITAAYIINKYGRNITGKTFWDEYISSYPGVVAEEIPLDEVFTVNSVFYLRRIGIVINAFKGTHKYYVLKSSTGQLSPIFESYYESYRKK